MGDFQRRLNRDRDQGWGARRDDGDRDRDRVRGRGWDSTPRSERGYRDAPSVRVPNVGWDSTPRNGHGDDGAGWGGARNRAWDAPTPRAVRGGSPEDGDGALGIDAREWEEEQVRLDRDWYTGAEEGGVAGDEENNPLAQYEDLSSQKEAEIANKQVVSAGSDWVVYSINPFVSNCRGRYRPDRHNMYVFLTGKPGDAFSAYDIV